MKTANEKLLDWYVRRQIDMLRFVGGLNKDSAVLLAASEKKLSRLIVSHISKLDDRRMIGVKGRRWQTDFRAALLEVRSPAWQEVADSVQEQLRQYATAEAGATAVAIQGAVPVVLGVTLPPAQQLVGIVNSQPFEGDTLKNWVARTAEADVQRILRYAKVGISQGLTPTQVARGVVGTKKASYQDGQARKALRDLESTLLTVTNGIQQEVRQSLYEANSDIVKKEVYHATLDVRTTLQCASNDRKIFLRGEGPIPPLHFRCRSTRVPYLDMDLINGRPFDSRTEKELLQEYGAKAKLGAPIRSRADLPWGHKTKFDTFARKRGREMMGTAPAGLSYNDWLKKQSVSFQDEVLGPTRAEMFRKGDITLDKFVARDGDTLTLAELSERGLQIPD